MDSFKAKFKKHKEAFKGGLKKGQNSKNQEPPPPAPNSPPSHVSVSQDASSARTNKSLNETSKSVPHPLERSNVTPLPDSSTVPTSAEARQSSADSQTHDPQPNLSSEQDDASIFASGDTPRSSDRLDPTPMSLLQGSNTSFPGDPPPQEVPAYPQPTHIEEIPPAHSRFPSLGDTLLASTLANPHPSSTPTVEVLDQPSLAGEKTPMSVPSQPSEESSRLWQDAYDQLLKKQEPLIRNYEIILKHASKLPSETDRRLEVAEVVASQKEKMENSQWTFQWNDKPQKVRDIISRILKITSKAAALISVGMTYAPPYVSIPWAAIGALIPLMMGGFDNEEEGISGLEKVAQIISSYRIVEDTFLKSSHTAKDYSEAVIGLYVKVLEYQAIAAQYFGRHTLIRFGSSIVGSTDWKAALASILELDNRSRGSVLHLGIRAQQQGFEMMRENFGTLITRFDNSDQFIGAYLKEFFVQKGDVDQLLTDLSTINYIQDHKDVRKELGSAYFSSGQWFLTAKTVSSWRECKSHLRVLWLVGSVGVGKSSLTSMLLENMSKDPSGKIAFFYCSRKASKKDQKTTARDNYENVLRTLLIQLSLTEDGSSISSDLQDFHRRSMQGIRGGGLELEECVFLLKQRLAADPKITIVIDALDECLNFTKLLTVLKDLLHNKKNARMFLTSRFEVDVTSHYGQVEKIVIEQQNAPDILRFIEHEMESRRHGAGMTDEQATELESILIERHEGMFTWVKLVIDDILDEVEEDRLQMSEDIEIRICELRDSEADTDERLKLAYDKVYAKATGSNGKKPQPTRRYVVDVALKWILCSFRPLTLTELAYATSVQADGSLKPRQGRSVLSLCSNFLVEGSAGVIRFTHVSVRQYLERREPPEYTALEAHTQAAMTCLLFMKSPQFHELGSHILEIHSDASPSLGKDLSSYIRTYWSRHCREAKQTAKIRDMAEAVSRREAAKPQTMVVSPVPDQHKEKPSPENAADNISAGSSNVRNMEAPLQRRKTALSEVEDLVSKFQASQSQNGTSTTLHGAVRLNEEDRVEFLIAADEDLTLTDEFGNTPLHEAVRYNRIRIVERLIDSEAPLDVGNNNGDCALHFAAFWGFQRVLKALISAGAGRDERNHRGETPLHIAILQRHDDIVRILCLAGVDVNASDNWRNRPLYLAAALGNDPAIVDLLISSGAHIDWEEDSTPDFERSDLESQMQRQSLHFSLRPKFARTNLKTAQERGFRDLKSYPSMSFAGLCDYCNLARWISVSSYKKSHIHLQSYEDLRTSALEGCKLCALFLREFETLQCQLIAEKGDPTNLSVTLSLARNSTSSTNSSDILTVTMGGILNIEVELCIDSHDFLQRYISGRTIGRNSADQPSFDWIQVWRETCYKGHERCVHNKLPPLPTRVIDVGPEDGSRDPILFETHGEKGNYAYLSFRWDPGTPDSAQKLMLKKERLQSRLQSLPFEQLGQTHWDAVIITRRLGLRYLWIDAQCLVQDDGNEWPKEAQTLGDYLTNSSFTIVAPGHGFDYGIFTQRDSAELLLQLEYRLDPSASHASTGRLSIRRPTKPALEAMSENVLQRGWMVQELVLAHRNLIFSAEQIYWNCQTLSSSESSAVTQRPLLRLKGNNDDEGLTEVLSRWYRLIETYSGTHVSVLTDRFPALRHMAGYVEQQIHSNYCAGLWQSDLLRGLLWRAKSITVHPQFQEYIAPTWSWAFLNGSSVSYSVISRVDRQNPNTTVLDVSITHRSELGPRGAIESGVLKLRALSRTISKATIPKSCDYYFDRKEYEDEWRAGYSFSHVLVSLWHTDLSDVNARWVGLILSVTGKDGLNEFCRVGLAIGPDQDVAAGASEGLKIKGWAQRDFTII